MGWQAVPGGCAEGMEPEGVTVTGRGPSIPALSPLAPHVPETIERWLHLMQKNTEMTS
jgi:hypothetical protein